MAKVEAHQKVHVHKGDTVVVISGKDTGKKGKVLAVLPQKQRVLVEGVNLIKRHTRPTQALPQGGILQREAPVHSSNVMAYCPSCNKPSRMGKRLLDDNTKVRVCKKCGEVLERK